MSGEALEFTEQLERVRTALAGLAPDQSERLVRMVELGAMICLVEDAAFERTRPGAALTPELHGRGPGRGSGRGSGRARVRPRTHAGAS